MFDIWYQNDIQAKPKFGANILCSDMLFSELWAGLQIKYVHNTKLIVVVPPIYDHKC